MQIYLLRHGQTEYNAQHRYQGQQDIPLSAAGRAQLRPAGFMPDVAYVSPRTADGGNLFPRLPADHCTGLAGNVLWQF